MRRSYGVSLVVAGVMLLGSQAMGMAPMISTLPSVIVGNEGIATPPNAFVYPDAFNLDNYVTDDATTKGGIIWSYEEGTTKYSINGVGPLMGGNPNNPGANRIDNQDSADPGPDSNPRTITIRDTELSPIGGPNTDPGTPGILNPAGEMVTLFASDGTTYSAEGKTMLIYTDDGGNDRLSPEGPVRIPVQSTISFLGGTTDWTSNVLAHSQEVVSHSANGLCVQVPASGNASIAEWISPYGIIDLIANKTWRIRAHVDAGSLPVGTTPLWSVVADNFSTEAGNSVIENKYGQELFFLDNLGGANSAGGTLKDYQVWFTPIALKAADWNDTTNGMFAPSKDAINDARIHFRVYDVDDGLSATNYGGQLDAGTVCLQSVSIDAFDVDQFQVVATPYDVQNITNGGGGAPGAGTNYVSAVPNGSTNVSFSGGNVTITPATGTSWDQSIIRCNPGNGVFDGIGQPSETPDDFPIPNVQDGLFRVTVGVMAPDATGETNPPDGIRVGMDNASTEVLMTGNVLATTNLLGMPKQSAVTDYMLFYDSHNLSANPDSIPNISRIRPRFDILNTTRVGVNSQAHNAGGVTVTYMKVEQLQPPVE